MKGYPSISGKREIGSYVYAFDKLDGSNIRVEWTPKKGFFKWGRRNGLLDHSNPHLLHAPPLILEGFSELESIFKDLKTQRATAYFEFFGSNSFAGSHQEGDDFQVVLLDVALYKKGFIGPKKFLEKFGKFDIPDVVFQGPLTEELVQQVKNSELENITYEGVVCKKSQTDGKMRAFKIKTNDWLDALRVRCGKDDKLFEILR